jgi:hypothetical protein
MIKLKDILNEDRMDNTKMFNQSTINKIASDIKKMVKFEKGYNTDFRYSEFNFSSGEGGFGFKWDHSKNMGGQIGVSFSKSGNHRYYNYSWYQRKYTGSATADTMKPFKFKGKPMVWEDFTNAHLLEFWSKAKKEILKNEKGANAALSAEAKAQKAHYGAKADTGRIGYGLSSQPRK